MEKVNEKWLQEVVRDKEQRHILAMAQRFCAYDDLDGAFHASFAGQEKAALLQQVGLAELTVEDALYLTDARVRNGVYEGVLPKYAAMYAAYAKYKLALRKQISEELAAPRDEKMRLWRERQIKRCSLEVGRRNLAITHLPVSFELSVGCSMRCPFCGVAAGRLTDVYQCTAENLAAWRKILKLCHEFCGAAAGQAICYYATEPLDNKEYELFNEAFYEEFGCFPELTTASILREVQRVKKLLLSMQERAPRVHRISLLSYAAWQQVLATFAPEELVGIDLLPQYRQAPACHFAAVGRARELSYAEPVGTIACISGFVINLAESSVRLVTPTVVDATHPTGEKILAKAYFATSSELLACMETMRERYMLPRLTLNSKITCLKNLKVNLTNEGALLTCQGDYQLRLAMPCGEYYKQLLQKIIGSSSTVFEIAAEAEESYQLPPANTIYLLQMLYQQGAVQQI